MKRKLLLIFARLKKNYTTDYMAKELGITRKQYSSIENGHTVNIKEDLKEVISILLDIDTTLLDIDEGNIIISGNKNNGFQIADYKNVQNQMTIQLLMKQLEMQQKIIQKQQEQIQDLTTHVEKHNIFI
jgi:transcriptional regulator with XRE-family HTH domain